MPEYDETDEGIRDARVALLSLVEGPRCGDFVEFTDATRRISYVWRDEDGNVFSVQTSDGGSFHLGDGYVSMSGSLFPGVPAESLELTDERRSGAVWFFHHDHWTAGNGVTCSVPFRVFTCDLPAPR